MSRTTRIVKTTDVLHGKPRIEGARIGVLQIGHAVRQHGSTVEAVAERYDIDAEQVAAAVEYYDEHPELVETVRAKHEAGPPSLEDDTRAE